MNKHAQQLGRMAAGVPKQFTKQELNKRRQRMARINARKQKGKTKL
jgi:hypothetical protein